MGVANSDAQRLYIINSTLSHIEALAGIGDRSSAELLANRLLIYDGSEKTRTLIEESARRAGRPGLLLGR